MAASEYDQQNQERDSVIAGQFDTQTFLRNLGRILKGFVWDSDSRQYVTIPEEGYLNHKGARQVLNEIEARIQNPQAHAFLRRTEIAQIRKSIWFAMSRKLFVYGEEFGLDHVNYKNVLYLIDDNLLNFLSRTENSNFFDKFPNFFKRQETISQTHYEQPEQKQRRFSI